MTEPHAIRAEVDAETLADLQRLADHWGRSVDHIVTTAVLRFVNEEIGAVEPDEFAHLPPYKDPSPTGRALDEAEAQANVAMRAFLKVGLDALDRGEVHSQEEMERWFADRVAARSQTAHSQAAAAE